MSEELLQKIIAHLANIGGGLRDVAMLFGETFMCDECRSKFRGKLNEAVALLIMKKYGANWLFQMGMKFAMPKKEKS